MNTKILDDLLQYFLSVGYPMAELAVHRYGKEIYHGRFGYTDVENKITPKDDTQYFFYSCSKPVTCAAALTLFEQGKFLLSDKLSDFLPEYKDMRVTVRNPDGTVTTRPAAREIQMLDLFTMTAGFSYNFGLPAIRKIKEESHGTATTREVIAALAQEPLGFDPGDKWNYSVCHDVLLAAVEVIAGERFGDYVKRVIFDPLGMDASSYLLPADTSKMAQQYRFSADFSHLEIVGSTNNSFMLTSQYESGGAGLVSTVADYMKFADMLSLGGIGANGARVLAPATVSLMKTDALTAHQHVSFNWPQLVGYGYGLGVRTLIDRSAAGTLAPLGEFGWNGAAGMRAMFDTTSGVSFLFAQHTLNPNKVQLLPMCRNAVFSALGE